MNPIHIQAGRLPAGETICFVVNESVPGNSGVAVTTLDGMAIKFKFAGEVDGGSVYCFQVPPAPNLVIITVNLANGESAVEHRGVQ